MLLAAVLGFLACAKLPVTEHGPGWDELRAAVEQEGVSVAATVRVEDLPAPPMAAPPPPTRIEEGLRIGEEHLPDPTLLDGSTNALHASFLRNDYIGNIRFGGGLIRMGETALETRARLVEFSRADAMREQGTAWLDDAVRELLTEAKVPPLPAPADFAPPAIERRPIRGAHKLDGRDNLNLPRLAISPTSAAASPEGDRWVLVPYLRAYYAHNGGWFLGQEWGCSGGARVEAMLVLYDRRTGHAAWWQVATGRYIQEAKAQPSMAELDQHLLYAEAQVEAAFERGFLR